MAGTRVGEDGGVWACEQSSGALRKTVGYMVVLYVGLSMKLLIFLTLNPLESAVF